jgi:7,8-dihydropterin-6-yl-methyl-4-(beta-D-ribofuranosyl)aminobenzene 5'-phosphate synthase
MDIVKQRGDFIMTSTAQIICAVDNMAMRSSAMWGEHGLSFWIQTADGRALFDSGQSGDVLRHNTNRLGLDLSTLDALAFSHAHYDHTGGLEAVLAQRPDIPLFANSDLLRPRFSLHQGEYESIGLALPADELARRTALHLSAAPQEILPGLWTTGEIRERPEAEGRSPRHLVRMDDEWKSDPYQDDLSLVLETERGLVLICGCCHAGLLNTLAHVRATFQQPIVAVLGGTHLVAADAADLVHVTDVLDASYPGLDYYLNHCTGEAAFVALTNAFGERVHPCPAGSIMAF